MVTRTTEIRSFLNHDDHSLAVRRILDTTLDTGDGTLLKEAIDFSRFYRQEKSQQLTQAFYSRAEEMLQKLEQADTDLNEHHLPLLDASVITKTYSTGHFSLHPISLQLYTGNILGVVGQNGHGKTTLLRCIAGQLALDGGHLHFAKLHDPDLYKIKQQVAFVPQRIPRWYGALKDNLHFSAAISGLPADENEIMVDFMLERLDLTPYAELTWDQISSGYRTRFELARVLLQKPDLLILDEPLANLDINAQQTILTDLQYMAKSVSRPMGVILSSQQLHEVEKTADTVLVIKNGMCLFRTGEEEKPGGLNVVELETKSNRETILQILGDENLQVHFNGGFFTISSPSLDVQQIISRLVENNIRITYLRDITHSTKRFI